MARIDVHHHLVAPKHVPQLREWGVLTPHLASIMNEEDALEDMEKGGVTLAVNSATLPEQAKGEARRAYSRENNDYMARLVRDYPGRFGHFASLPLPDVDGALKEIEYAFDVLKCDGVHLITSYDDHWLGDKIFAPVFAELNRRKAVVYTHPHGPMCTQGILKEIVIRDSSIEYGTDTTRALVNMLFGGTFQRCPDIKIIWSHGGGTMPFLLVRFTRGARAPQFAKNVPNGFVHEARKFYYDTAAVYARAPLLALREVVTVEQIVFGTDVPWGHCDEIAKAVAESGVFNADELKQIDRENALRILPRYK